MAVHVEEYHDGKLLNNRTWVTDTADTARGLVTDLVDTGSSSTEVTVRCSSPQERQSFHDLEAVTVL